MVNNCRKVNIPTTNANIQTFIILEKILVFCVVCAMLILCVFLSSSVLDMHGCIGLWEQCTPIY